ncbi:hypothetical protein OGATHE_003905 [Ogataea polymorpha]|uniref:Uncharacterized protein n=1 Tax=Ogataea polymorpha TaxID=460523 RepID=A0A9P8T4I0_9ASCO|nr:hypothetical protein OGATHE_003905 [Ogataea polymorpha]
MLCGRFGTTDPSEASVMLKGCHLASGTVSKAVLFDIDEPNIAVISTELPFSGGSLKIELAFSSKRLFVDSWLKSGFLVAGSSETRDPVNEFSDDLVEKCPGEFMSGSEFDSLVS